jgi:hypothetical protein
VTALPEPGPSARVNLTNLPDLPVPADSANLREGPDLHPLCAPLLPLVGVWRGEGEVVYPTIDGPFHFGQQIVFAHDGRPFLTYSAQAWLLDGPGGAVVRPAARETGFWRPQEDGSLEVLLTHATGIVEIYHGGPRGLTSWEIATDVVMRTQTAKEVNSAQRLYGLVDSAGDDDTKDLAYVDERAMVGQPLQPHISARLARIAG